MTPAHNEPEWLIRKAHIDAALAAAGSTVLPWSADLVTEVLAAHAVEELPTDNGPADYALFVAGRLLGILEAQEDRCRASERSRTGQTLRPRRDARRDGHRHR